MLTKDHVAEILTTIVHPVTGRDLLASGALAKAAACDGYASATLNLSGVSERDRGGVCAAVEQALRRFAERRGYEVRGITVDAVGGAEVASGRSVPLAQAPAGGNGGAGKSAPAAGSGGSGGGGGTAAPAQQSAPALPGVRTVIAVGAGKGGVGKSTVAVNLAVGLALRGQRVGLLDGDIYGPSLPTMLGLDQMAVNIKGNMLQPFEVHGVRAMTIGKLVDPEKALIWRGPMAHGAFKQLVEQTEWGELDTMIVDLPPGTGDVSLTLAQTLRLTGAVVVCTPQKVAQDDAVRAVRMFQQLGIEVLGIVENMSSFFGDDGKEYDLFGKGGAQLMAQRLGLPFLGAVPITMALRSNGDEGTPGRNFEGPTPLARSLDAMVSQLEAQVALASMRMAGSSPKLTIS
ncbi:MAG: Mrp/NBP35 family ATP-binding protein [Phycisphaerales bacterium]